VIVVKNIANNTKKYLLVYSMDENIYKQIFDKLVEECCKDEHVLELRAKVLDPMIKYMGLNILPYVIVAILLIVIFVSSMVCCLCMTLQAKRINL
jgi:hypothetical protein